MNASVELYSESLEKTLELGESLGALLRLGDVVLLSGDLGAGKTHFTKGVVKGMGIEAEVTSPTFNILVQYENQMGSLMLNHFDLYRLESEEELDDIDYFGHLEQEAVQIVEWGDKFTGALPEDYLSISFKVVDAEERALLVEAHGARSNILLEAWLGESA
jgi:tRNA threonylcarbamoyladenosine biosynthesis protein TsaE